LQATTKQAFYNARQAAQDSRFESDHARQPGRQIDIRGQPFRNLFRCFIGREDAFVKREQDFYWRCPR